MDRTLNPNFAERVVTVPICFLKPFHGGLGEPQSAAYGAKSQTKHSASISDKKKNLLLPPCSKTNRVA